MKNDSIKRRDSKGRILRNGESQAPDGRYRYSYYVNGKQKNLYSWKLELHDKLPAGKRQCKSLREQEKELQLQQFQGIRQENMTVMELTERYIKIRDVSLKKQPRQDIKQHYNY
ncbi:MAG: integrase DNA-binding domain-containing protein [Roseburia sp.]|jgi:hypothetical protein|uniref:integrase DNA-binding domain-containing protein n=1 Tax=Blautia obeum TaxID=40520 RepID=UPI001FC821A8|nr:integrase DNA-binding domain-containing protein [Blautia obeum]